MCSSLCHICKFHDKYQYIFLKFSRFQSENILKQEEKSFTIDVEKEAEFLIKSDYDLSIILGEDTLNQLSRFQEVKVRKGFIYYILLYIFYIYFLD